jgi:GT2 family glycosyltransferase
MTDSYYGHVTVPSVATPLVVVVAYRSDDYLGAALAYLDGELDAVIVDNDASPATARLASAVGARYVPTPRNLGFAAAVNVGLRETWDGTRDVLLLNPDARVRCRDVFALQQALRAHPRLAAVGPRLVDDQGRTQRSDWPFPSPGQVWFDAFALGRFWHGQRFVVGAVLLLRAEALAQVGDFDERYFLYAEEADWQLRAQRLGWEVQVIGSVAATHVGGASSDDATVRARHFYTSGAAFADRWYGRPNALVMRLGSMVAAGRRAILGSSGSRALNRRVLRLYLRGGLREAAAREQGGAR